MGSSYIVNFIVPSIKWLNSATFMEKFPGLESSFLSVFRFLYFRWSYLKIFKAGEFVLSYQFIHKNFWLVRGSTICPVSVFCTSHGHIWKISMQVNSFYHTNSSIKISGWSGVRFFTSHGHIKNFCRIFFDIYASIKFSNWSGVRFSGGKFL